MRILYARGVYKITGTGIIQEYMHVTNFDILNTFQVWMMFAEESCPEPESFHFLKTMSVPVMLHYIQIYDETGPQEWPCLLST